MKISCMASSDLISQLPSSIVENILMFLPLKDAGRTSVLSRKWRYQWATIPALVFDEDFFLVSFEETQSILLKIYYILSLHQGSILKFNLSVPVLKNYSEMDKLIILLTRKGMQELSLRCWGLQHHEFPCYIYRSLQQLRHLKLRHVMFNPPTFDGFTKLISLELQNVDFAPGISTTSFPVLESFSLSSFIAIKSLSIEAPRLKVLRIKAPIRRIIILDSPFLTVFFLTTYWDTSVDLIKLFDHSPLIEHLHLYRRYLKFLAVSNAENKAPYVLSCLRTLELSGVILIHKDELLTAFCLIRNSEYLQELKLKIFQFRPTNFKGVVDCLKQLDSQNVSLKNLRYIQVECRTVYMAEIELIKIMLAISPELETLHIRTSDNRMTARGKRNMLKLQKLKRASSKARITYLGMIINLS